MQGGYNGENDPLYIGRARHEDSYAVGKVAVPYVLINFKIFDLNSRSTQSMDVVTFHLEGKNMPRRNTKFLSLTK